MTRILTLDNRATVTITDAIAKGGEGTIHRVLGHPEWVAKLFHDDFSGLTAKERVNKLRQLEAKRRKLPVLVARKPGGRVDSKGFTVLAWPERLLLDNGAVVGYVMPRLDLTTYALLHNIANASDREHPPSDDLNWISGVRWDHLLNVAQNLCRAVDVVHRAGVVIGDFNESNIMVSNTTGVTLIDCDSMQVRDVDGTVHRCTVWKEEYLTPELFDVDLSRVERTKSSDYFALAVHIYQLLLDGNHPFRRGDWTGGGDRPPVKALIKTGQWAGGRASRFKPNPKTPDPAVLLAELHELFERAFVTGIRQPEQRPDATEWRQALARIATISCYRNGHHVYPSSAGSCPWCELDRRKPGPNTAAAVPPLDDLAMLRAKLAGHAPAAPVPPFSGVAPKFTRVPGIPPAPSPPVGTPPISPSAPAAFTSSGAGTPTGTSSPSGSLASTSPATGIAAVLIRLANLHIGRRLGVAGIMLIALTLALHSSAVLVKGASIDSPIAEYWLEVVLFHEQWFAFPTIYAWCALVSILGSRYRFLVTAAVLHIGAVGATPIAFVPRIPVLPLRGAPALWTGLLSNVLAPGAGWAVLMALVGAPCTIWLSWRANRLLAKLSAQSTGSRAARAVQIRAWLGQASSTDRKLFLLVVIGAGTFLPAWIIGRVLLQDNFIFTTAVLNTKGRESSDYAFPLWLGGTLVITSLAGIGLLAQWFKTRRGHFGAGIILLFLTFIVGWPFAIQQWRLAEAKTAERMALTPYPFSDEYVTCGRGAKILTDSSGEQVLWQVHTARINGSVATHCNRLVIYRGWQRMGQVDLEAPAEVKDPLMPNYAWTTEESVFTGKDTRGKSVQVKIAGFDTPARSGGVGVTPTPSP